MSSCRYLSVVAAVAVVLTLPSQGLSQAKHSTLHAPNVADAAVAVTRIVPAIRVLVDPRIELMSIVLRLAGYPEYSMGRVQSYTVDLDAYFATFKDHPVVISARQLRKTRGISFNAPMSLAVHLTNPPQLAERVPFDPLPVGIDSRWTVSEARRFLADLRSFVRETNAMEFLVRHSALYEAATERLVSMTREARILEWFEGFFRQREDREFVLVAGLLNGGGNYGALTRGLSPARGPSAAGKKMDEFFCILGTESTDEHDMPSYPPRIAATIVHEFCHSFVNPLVDVHEDELKAVTDRLYSLVQAQMRSQAYGVPKAMMYESLVRACTVRYLSSHLSAEAARREAALDRLNGFPWVGRLAETLLEYERDRARYPTLEAFVPRVVGFFEDYSRTAAEDIRAIEAEQRTRQETLGAKGPKVVSTSPADAATDVDAVAVTAITITFDRPMREGNFALFPVVKAALPTLKGPPRFDAKSLTLTLTCELKPGVTYGLQFNSPEHMAFVDMEGNPLAPFVYRFTTRK